MKFKKPLLSITALVTSFRIASALTTVSKPSSYSESYPAVVCPPTLNGLTSQISISSTKTQYQRLENRSSKTLPFKALRFPVSKDSLVITALGTTPLIWQSRSGSWAGGTLCSGPKAAACNYLSKHGCRGDLLGAHTAQGPWCQQPFYSVYLFMAIRLSVAARFAHWQHPGNCAELVAISIWVYQTESRSILP